MKCKMRPVFLKKMLLSRKRLSASVSVIALVSVTILLLIALILIQLLTFTAGDMDRSAEVLRSRWFLEGRVNEYFDGLMNGDFSLSTGEFTFVEPIDGEEQRYTFDVSEEDGIYTVDLFMRWKDRYNTEQSIRFSRLNFFDYVLFFNTDVSISLEEDLLVYGDIAARGSLSIDNNGHNFYSYVQNDFVPQFDYLSDSPTISPSFFTNSIIGLFERPYIDFTVGKISLSASKMKDQNLSLENLKLPSFVQIWNAYADFADSSYVLSEIPSRKSRTIVNYMSGEKELIGYGNGNSTQFKTDREEMLYVYIKSISSGNLIQEIGSLDYAYYSAGTLNSSPFYELENGFLTLKASSEPVQLTLPEDALNSYGGYLLKTEGYRFISLDESLKYLYFDTPYRANRLIKGVDFDYYPSLRWAKITSKAFFYEHSFDLGTGDGKTTSFDFFSPSGSYAIYNGDEKTKNYSIIGSSIVFDSAPSAGNEIHMLYDLPELYFQKEPPSDGTGVFLDLEEDCRVLDLDEIQNYPSHGVIYSYVPILVKGSADEPLVVLSKENIYVQNINPEGSGSPVMLISESGIWAYRPTGITQNPLNKCILITPLNSIYTVYESGLVRNPPMTIWGSVFFTGEGGSTMEYDTFGKNYLYYEDIALFLDTEPFSLFPLPIELLQIRRD